MIFYQPEKVGEKTFVFFPEGKESHPVVGRDSITDSLPSSAFVHPTSNSDTISIFTIILD